MQQIKLDKFFTGVLVLFITTFIAMGLEIRRELQPLILGSFGGFLVFLIIILLLKNQFNVKIFRMIIPFFLLELLYVINYKSEFFWIIYQLLFIGVIYIISNIKFEKYQLFILSSISLIIILFLFGISFFYVGSYLVYKPPFMSASPNPNGIAIWAFYLSYIPILYFLNYSKKWKKVKLTSLFIVLGILIINVDSRSIVITALVILVTYINWNKITKNNVTYFGYFALILVGIFFFIQISINLNSSNALGRYLNDLSMSIFQKSLFSGRNVIWQSIASYIQQRPVFGYGSGFHYQDIAFNSELSSHNLYLEILLQLGIIGLMVLIWLFTSIFGFFKNNINDNRVKLSASFFIGILVNQTFEISLLQASVLIGLVQWIIISIGLSFVSDQET